MLHITPLLYDEGQSYPSLDLTFNRELNTPTSGRSEESVEARHGRQIGGVGDLRGRDVIRSEKSMSIGQ